MDGNLVNLIETQRTLVADKLLSYPNSPQSKANERLEQLGLIRNDLPENCTDENILEMSKSTANDLKMQSLCDAGKFEEVIPLIQATLDASVADDAAYKRLQRFTDSNPDSDSEDSRNAICKIAYDASMAKRKLSEEQFGPKIKPGQLNYSTVVPGVNVQPTLI